MKSRSTLPYWWMLLGSIFFTCMGTLSHFLRDDLPWQTIALVRTSLAFLIAATMTYAGGAQFVVLRPATMWMRSIAGSCSLVLTFYALTRQGSLAEVLVLTNMFPIWVALLSWPMLGKAPRLGTWVAISIGIAGVVVVKNPMHSAGINPALVAALIASLTTSVALLGLHRLHSVDPRSIVTHFSAVSVVFCLATLWLFPHEHSHAALGDYRVLLMLLGVGVTATLGQLSMTKAFATGAPAKVSVVSLSQIGLGALVDAVLFNHQLSLVTMLGMLLIMAPTVWLLLRSDAPQSPTILPDEKVVPPQVE